MLGARAVEGEPVSSVDDVAAAVLARVGQVTTWKLQKLVYYSQAWHLVRHGEQLFDDRIEAWRQGPVIRKLYNQHRQQSRVMAWPRGDATNLTAAQTEIVDWVTQKYGSLTAETLSEMTHAEAPWFLARGALPRDAPSDEAIDIDVMRSFYSRQEAKPTTAVAQALANAALEDVELDAAWEEALGEVARGAVTPADLIRREISHTNGG